MAIGEVFEHFPAVTDLTCVGLPVVTRGVSRPHLLGQAREDDVVDFARHGERRLGFLG